MQQYSAMPIEVSSESPETTAGLDSSAPLLVDVNDVNALNGTLRHRSWLRVFLVVLSGLVAFAGACCIVSIAVVTGQLPKDRLSLSQLHKPSRSTGKHKHAHRFNHSHQHHNHRHKHNDHGGAHHGVVSAKMSSLSMFCFLVAQPYELPLVSFQFKKRWGIFACDDWAVFSDGSSKRHVIGKYDSGKVARTIPIPGRPAEMGTMACSWAGCQGTMDVIWNANVLLRAWDHIIKFDMSRNYAWTVKVDADSAFTPQRLVRQMRSHGMLDVPDKPPGRFFKNCQRFDSMQGPLEVLSREAVHQLSTNVSDCKDSMDWMHMAEDIFLHVCLKQLGSEPLMVDTALKDGKCSGWGIDDCKDPTAAVFHPKKSVKEQHVCWKSVVKVGT